MSAPLPCPDEHCPFVMTSDARGRTYRRIEESLLFASEYPTECPVCHGEAIAFCACGEPASAVIEDEATCARCATEIAREGAA